MNFFKHVKEISPADEQAIQEAENIASDKATRQKVLGRFSAMDTWLGRNSSNRTIVEYVSWASNFVMACAAYWGMKIFLEPLGLGSSAYVVAGIMLIGLELVKRKLSDSIFDGWFYAKYVSVPAVALLLIIGIGDYWMSYNGAHWGVKDNSEQAKLMGEAGDPEAIAMLDQVKQVDASIAEHRANKNAQGTIYWSSQKAIEKLEGQKATLLETLGTKHQTYSIQNEHVVKDWRERIAFQSSTSVYITSFAWVVFFICMAFRSHYDARLARALSAAKAQPVAAHQHTQPQPQQGAAWNPNPILNQVPPAAQPATPPPATQPLYTAPDPSSFIGRLSTGVAAAQPQPLIYAQSIGSIPPVATGCNQVATKDEDDDDIDLKAMKRARANAVAGWKAWRGKDPKSEAAKRTQQTNMAILAAEIADYDLRLSERYGITMKDYTV